MTVKDNLLKMRAITDEIAKEVHAEKTMADDISQSIIDTMQHIEDTLSNLLAEYGVEIGDERID